MEPNILVPTRFPKTCREYLRPRIPRHQKSASIVGPAENHARVDSRQTRSWSTPSARMLHILRSPMEVGGRRGRKSNYLNCRTVTFRFWRRVRTLNYMTGINSFIVFSGRQVRQEGVNSGVENVLSLLALKADDDNVEAFPI